MGTQALLQTCQLTLIESVSYSFGFYRNLILLGLKITLSDFHGVSAHFPFSRLLTDSNN